MTTAEIGSKDAQPSENCLNIAPRRISPSCEDFLSVLTLVFDVAATLVIKSQQNDIHW